MNESGKIESNGIELFYESFGPKDAPPLLFIMGLSAQMVFWPKPLIDQLVAEGFRVIRFDNRDVGMSTRINGGRLLKPGALIARSWLGMNIPAPYTLHDMVADTVGLLDALELESAHFIGASMGGMISQLTAAGHPQRVKSLTSIMSGTNSRWLPPPKPSALKALVAPAAQIKGEEDFIAFGVGMMKALGGTLPQGDELTRQMFRESWQRGVYPRGIRQQLTAVLATGDLTKHVKRIQCPTTVIHGSHDPLIRPAGGKASARHIPGARLEIIKGMGHDLPEVVLPKIGSLIAETARRA